MQKNLTYKNLHFIIAVMLLPIAIIISINSQGVLAGIQVQSRFDQLANSQGGVTTTHNIGFTYTNNSTPIGSILIQFCSDGAIVGTPCTLPVGMDLTAAVLSAQTGNLGYSISSITVSSILLTRNPSNPNNSPSTYTFNNIVNPTSPGEYWSRIQTFSSIDATGPYVEQGGIAFAITSQLTISSIVPPYLTFCGGITVSNLNCGSAIGNEISYGDFSDLATSTGTSQFVVATNAAFGYNVTIHGETMTSGNFIIPQLKTPTASRVGVSQFGLNIVANSIPRVGLNSIGRGIASPNLNYGTTNYFSYNDGDTVVSSSNATDFNEFTASYLVNVSADQAEGVYATTLYYICLANF